MKISVVIPLYNKERAILRTLESVVAQTFHDYEIVIVNDGSTDDSNDVVKLFIKEHPEKNIRLLQQSNSGVSAARNAGILAAKGEYIAFLDADDYWESNVLMEYTQLIHEYPDASLYALGCGSMYNGIKYPCKSKVESGYRGYMKNVWEYNPTFLVTASCCCCRRDTAIHIGGFDTRMTHGEDYDMWWRLLFIGELAYYNKTLVYYVQDAENRAMHRMPQLENYIPFYIDKYKEEREKNVSFRKFCDDELARRLYPYLLDKKTQKKARELLCDIDWTLLKPSLKWRMRFPRLYTIYNQMKEC